MPAVGDDCRIEDEDEDEDEDGRHAFLVDGQVLRFEEEREDVARD